VAGRWPSPKSSRQSLMGSDLPQPRAGIAAKFPEPASCICSRKPYPWGMATRAQQHDSQQQISNSKAKAKRRVSARNAHKPAPHVDAAVRGVTGAGKATRNFGKRSDNKGGPALEVSDGAKPSRKSTRSSAGAVKQATNLTQRQKRQVHSPKERATRAAVRS
jgi:hypothetical protein